MRSPGATPGIGSGAGSGAATSSFAIPASLGSIRILEELGRGATGVVHRGRDAMLGRDVAVKFLLGAVTSPDDPGFASFLKGASSAAGVLHPSLTLVHHLDQIAGVPYLVMQYVDGPSVGELLRRSKPERAEALAVLVATASGVTALHDAGIIHRDLKPANILLSLGGEALVTDFGFAFPAGAAVRQSSPFGVTGTPAYMVPEMFDGDVSPRTDVYALGVTAFQLLTGQLPFAGPVETVREAHRRDPLPADAIAAAGLSPGLTEVLERATSKRPLFRYKSARPFLHALCDACPDLPAGTRATSAILRWVTRGRPTGPGAAESQQAPSVPATDSSSGPRGAAGTPTPGASTSSRGDIGDLLKTVRQSRRRLRPDSDPSVPPKSSPPPIPPPL